MRMIFIALLVPIITGWFFLYGYNDFEKHLANWGVVIVLASLICSGLLPYSKNYRRKPRLMAMNHSLMSLAILVQIIDLTIFWLTGSSKIKSNKHSQLMVIYQYILHTVPAIACLYNFLITDFLFYRKYYKVCLSLTVLYFAGNFIKDRVLYEIDVTEKRRHRAQLLKWDDKWSMYLIAVTCCISIIIPYILAPCTEVIKARRLPHIERENNNNQS